MRIEDPKVLEEVSVSLKAMADPTRLRILQELMENERTVSELIALVGTSQGNVSKHLAILKRAHLVASTREGTSVCYRLSAEFVPDVCAAMCRGLADRLADQDRLRRSVNRVVGRSKPKSRR